MKKAGVIACTVILFVTLLILALANVFQGTGGAEKTTPPISSETQTVSKPTSQYDKGFFYIRDASLIDYTVPKLTTMGTVSEKLLLLDEAQVVYQLKITLDELNSSSVNYYCTSQVYDSVEAGARVSVTYQKVTESAFSIYSVTAEK